MHTVRRVLNVIDHIIFQWLSKARPARARIKLLIGIKQWLITANARVTALFKDAAMLARKGPLGTLSSRDLKLITGQLLGPLLIRFFYPAIGGRVTLARIPDDGIPIQHTVTPIKDREKTSVEALVFHCQLRTHAHTH
jgi:hypothetical protein